VTVPCPCGSQQPLAACCGATLDGAEPADAEALMRSRYTAFVLGRYDHLIRTLHPDHPDLRLPRRAVRERLAKHGKRARYRGLAILDRDGPDARGAQRVLFRVTMLLSDADASFVELSRFLHDGTGLRYHGGTLVDPRALDREGVTTIAALEGLLAREGASTPSTR
jgi:SEC-C motif-containing protein